MNDLGKLLVIIGIVLVILGAVIWKTDGLGGLGRLPGDITVQKGSSSFYFAAGVVGGRGRLTSFPIVTCLLISAVPGLTERRFQMRCPERGHGIRFAPA